MKKIGNEIKTGVMVVACLAILAGFTIRILGTSTLKKGYHLKVRFNFASAIRKGAPVYLAGVEAGEIKGIQINYTPEGTNVMLDAWLESSAKVRQDSRASIVTMGLMGEKYLELTSGTKESPFLEEGSLIIGKEPLMMDEIIDKAMGIANNVDAGIADLRKLIQDADSILVTNQADIARIIDNLNATSENFKEFSDDIRRNPWKILMKTKEKPKEEPAKQEGDKSGGNKGSFNR
jgi:phospholipid/cholesterol/gamma-HCH transport system substrate-binding protein